MNGKERRYLTEPDSQSHESLDSHSEKAEVRTKTETQRFINKKMIVKRSNLCWFKKKAGDARKPWFL